MREYRWPVRVYYEDTDAGGVVYYANYLKFMERARTEWLRDLGFEQDSLVREQGILFAVTEVALRYLSPARFNDALVVTSQVVERRRASLQFAQTVYREDQALCAGRIRIACLDAVNFRPRPLPDRLIEELVDVD